MSEVDGATLIARSLKQQGIDHLFGIVGFPVVPIAVAAQKEGTAYLGMPDDIIRGKCDHDKIVEVERVPEPPRSVAPAENVEAALNLLERAERPLVLLGKGMGWSRAEDEVRAFIERTQLPFVRS